MKIKNLFKRSQGGYTTAEMLIAFFIMTVAISGVSTIAFGNQSVSVDTEKNSEALRIAQAVAEDKRAMAKTNFDSLQTSDCDTAGYECEVLVSSPQQNLKQITTTVSWVEGNRPQSVVLKSRVANLEEEEATGGTEGGGNRESSGGDDGGDDGTGSGGGSGGSNGFCPTVNNIFSQDTTASLAGKTTGLDVVNNLIYLSLDTSGDNTLSDFVILDSNNLNKIVKISELKTQSGGLNAIDIANGYAYTVGKKLGAQLEIINVSSSTSPSLESFLDLSSAGLSIFYRDNKVYAGTENNPSGPEFYVIDVTDSSLPSVLGSFEIGGGVNQIVVRGNTAYLATTHGAKDIVVLDVSNPTSILETRVYNNSYAAAAQSLYFYDSKIFAGSNPNLLVLDPSTNPVNLTASNSMPMNINDIVISGNLGFLGTDLANKRFQIWDMSNLSDMKYCTSSDNISPLFNAPVTGIIYQNGLAYVAMYKNGISVRVVKLN